MRLRTGLGLAAAVLALCGVALLAVSGGAGGSLSVVWVSDTATDARGNHHAPVAGTVDGERYVFAPISGRSGAEACRLAGLDAADGETAWRVDVAPTNCTIHAVADPVVEDVDGDGRSEVLASTTAETVVSVDPATGDAETLVELSSYGYTEPVVANLTGAGPAVAVVDYEGTAVVLGPDGAVRWRADGTRGVEAQPRAADVDGDDRPELVVAATGGAVTVYDGDGTVQRRHAVEGSPVSVVTTPGENGRRVVYTTAEGGVVAFDGDGVAWRRSLGELAMVETALDGDDDGVTELYVGTADGRVRALSAGTGETAWSTAVTREDVQVVPGPVAGDVDDDGDPELVVASQDGRVSVLDPADGDVGATYERDVPVYVHPRLGDVDGDGTPEVLVVYGDGRVVALSAV
jgi:hypothetical protein